MDKNIKISIAIPYYSKMENADFFMDKCLESIKSQTYKNYEIIITEEGVVGHNLNEAMKRCMGEYIKIMCMDDCFAHSESLKDIVDTLNSSPKQWLISGCSNNPNPYYTGDIHQGNNKLGGLSAITVKNENLELFDPSLKWLVDCDFYKRMYAKYGMPHILNGANVYIGEGQHQATNTLQEELKKSEVIELTKRYAR